MAGPSASCGRAQYKKCASRAGSASRNGSSEFTPRCARRKPHGTDMTADEKFMQFALREAERGVGQTSPNPAVGALIVSPNEKILARGWHRGPGLPHAEIEALNALRRPDAARGASLY